MALNVVCCTVMSGSECRGDVKKQVQLQRETADGDKVQLGIMMMLMIMMIMMIMMMVGVHLQGSLLRRRSLGTDLSEAEMGRVFTVQINLSPTCSKSSPFSTKIMFTISSRPHYLVNRNAPAYVSVLARVPILQKLVFRKQIICIIFFINLYLYLYLFTCMHLLPLY